MIKTLTVGRLAAFCGIVMALMLQPVLAKAPKPLFASDEVLEITLTAPFRTIIKNAPTSTDPFTASLTLQGEASETHTIELSARGNSRRDKKVCQFPPLRVEFSEKPGDTSLFDGQKRLKLVTHCRRTRNFDQHYLLEYAAYKLFNVVTPHSLKVRLAKIEYVEAENGRTMYSRMGFFIEDTDDAAKRNDIKEIDIAGIDVAQLDPSAAANYALFQFMIGNLDWSMHSSLEGDDCCHNTKLIGSREEPLDALSPVPYDFDYSGLVNTPYAIPPETINVRSVRTRRYRGFCVHNDELRNAIPLFIEKREELYAAIENIDALKNSKRNSATRFLGSFFKVIEDDRRLQSQIFERCRN